MTQDVAQQRRPKERIILQRQCNYPTQDRLDLPGFCMSWSDGEVWERENHIPARVDQVVVARSSPLVAIALLPSSCCSSWLYFQRKCDATQIDPFLNFSERGSNKCNCFKRQCRDLKLVTYPKWQGYTYIKHLKTPV